MAKFCNISLLYLFKLYKIFGTNKNFISCKNINVFFVIYFEICLHTQSLNSLYAFQCSVIKLKSSIIDDLSVL